jgi:hypothetical protein
VTVSQKSALYNLLKAQGVEPAHAYRDYTIPHLLEELQEHGVPEKAVQDAIDADILEKAAANPEPVAPVSGPDPEELPGQRLNTAPDQPIRTDEAGRVWYQEEVLKPAYPKPRGRRVLKYLETGVKVETVQNGEYVETFEVAGVGEARPAEVKITLPSYQVGIYLDPRFPFKIHCYNGREGFDFYEVQDYWGGSELVPETVKRVYVENDLCYDIRSVIRTIQAEHRQLQLSGRLPE